MQRLRIGTRGSALALAQTRQTAARLESHGIATELVVIRTSGDRLADVSLAKVGGKGLFIKELEEALAAGSIDLAIHSMKDVPALLPEAFEIAAIPVRAAVEDVIVVRAGVLRPEPPAAGRGAASHLPLDDLESGVRIGTGSLRRGAQIASRRPDLRVVPLRGNVDTRLRKLADGEVEAIVLAAAGLRRLGLSVDERALDPVVFVPAPGQGALAIEMRRGDPAAARVAVLHDPKTASECAAERRLSLELGASCVAPVAALARVVGSGAGLEVAGLVATLDGRRVLRAEVAGRVDEADGLGARLAERLVAQGAREILDEIERSIEGG